MSQDDSQSMIDLTQSSDDNPIEQLTEPTKVKDLWFDDGNIVLRAEMKLFKVFRGILSRQGSVFRDMFSFPQPDILDPAESMDGCPLVVLSDGEDETEYFLRAMFEPRFLPAPPAQSTYRHVLGVLRLAHKYGCPDLRYRALQHLAASCPTTLQGCILRDSTKTLKSATSAELFFTANVVSEVGETWALPYVLSRIIQVCSVEKIYMGASKGLRPGEESLKLIPSYQLLCLQAYMKNASALRKILSFLAPTSPSTHCLNRAACNASRHTFLDKVEQRSREHATWARRPLTAWPVFERDFLKSVCSQCQESCAKQYSIAKEEYWKHLPKWFGITAGWSELEKLKSAALKDPNT